MRETDVLVAGAGRHGIAAALAAQDAGARVLICEKRSEPLESPPPGLRVLSAAMVTDVILSEDGEVAGALMLDGDTREMKPVRAKAVILATGGPETLWVAGGDAGLTGDGLAIAHRAGAELEGPRVRFETEGTPVFVGGVACDADGATTVPGLHVTGPLTDLRIDGALAGTRAAKDAPPEARPFGPYAVNPGIDPPLPRGFMAAKFDRLRRVMQAHLGPVGPQELGVAESELLQLKGEADEFARARLELDLHSFRNGCEVALMFVRAAERAGEGE